MVCYSPLCGYYSAMPDADGVFPVRVTRWGQQPVNAECFDVPCGNKCVGCLLERSRQWAVRCYHESKLYERNCFVTLTFSPEGLVDWKGRKVPRDEHGSVHLSELQRFLKRLRKKYVPRVPADVDRQEWLMRNGIRFFACGEYGAQGGRPHYHLLLFNHRFEDEKPWKDNHRGERLSTSEQLEQLWPHGFSSLGALTFQSAAYVARYLLKKQTGIIASQSTASGRKAEFVHMSKKPGIGFEWFRRHHADWYARDTIVVDGKRQKPPRYYDQKYAELDPLGFSELKKERRDQALAQMWNSTSKRLAVREEVKKYQISALRRDKV